MNKNMIKIGYAPTRRDVFSVSEALKFKDIVLDKIKEYGAEIVDINDINNEGLLYSSEDIEKTAVKFKNANVDGIFFPHCNFGSEDLVAKVAKLLCKPVLLWGPRDDSPLEDGLRTRDTQCGLFATGKVLRRFNVPFSYIVNCKPEDKVFENGFKNFTAVCSVVKAFKKTRILQIAPRPAGFWTMICNEGELLEKFGIEVFPITLQDVANGINRILKNKDENYIKSLENAKSLINCSNISNTDLEKIIALKVLIKELCEKEKCNCAAIQCWTALQDTIGIMPCVANGLLTGEGIPVVCETDIHGAISSVMLQEAALSITPTFFADFTIRHPTNDNAELLWHCGNFPVLLADEKSKKEIRDHFIFPSHCTGTGEWELKKGDITVCRFDGDHGEYSLLIGEGKGADGPKTKGTYVWFEVKDWPKWEEKIVKGPYVHHCAGIHGKVSAVLYESCKYIPGLRPDPVEPTEEEILYQLRGM